MAPVLRAGLGMLPGFLELVPNARVGHLGLQRDERTAVASQYYAKLPKNIEDSYVLLIDPMLATGGSSSATVDILKRWGAPRIKYMGLIAAPEGIARLQADHPDVPIHVAAIDSHLNEHGYIVPGLGDAGDRQFGTG